MNFVRSCHNSFWFSSSSSCNMLPFQKSAFFQRKVCNESKHNREFYQTLLKNNRVWSEKVQRNEPEYFATLANIQRPKVLWIGCSDSRIPPTDITGTRPGDIFVQRNVANLVVHTDMNLMTVLQYAVEYLGIQHIIVCGHYNCGGVAHAMSHRYSGLINKWLTHIKDVYRMHEAELEAIENVAERERRLVELNVMEQVWNLCATSFLQKAWKKNGGHGLDHPDKVVPSVHGWVYDVRDGLVKDLNVDITKMSPIFRLDIAPPKTNT